jgi:hypothetical protein
MTDSHWDRHLLGADTSPRSWSLAQYIAADAAFVRAAVAKHVLPLVRGGAATTDLLMLDIEHPFQLGQLELLDDATLAAAVNATRLRVQTVRQLMPRARVGLFETAGCGNCSRPPAGNYCCASDPRCPRSSAGPGCPPGGVAAMERAGALGLYDDVTHLHTAGLRRRGAKGVLDPLGASPRRLAHSRNRWTNW